MASKETSNVNVCAECENNKLQPQGKVPERPQRLRLKTEHYYDVKLPTYEESQKKYAKFMKALPQDSERR